MSSSSSPPHGISRPWPATPLYSVLLLFVCLATVAVASPPSPKWSTNCESPYSHCAEVETYESWSRASGTAKFMVNARFINYAESATVWYVGDYYGGSLVNLAPDAKLNVVWVQPRGTGGSTPSLVCERDKLDDYCQPKKACVDDMKKHNAEMFSIENAAQDLNWAIQQLNKEGKPIVILGEGFGSAVAMRYMKNNANNSVAAILLNPVHPILHNHFFDMWQGYDAVMQRLLHFCDEDTTCSARLGATEGAWPRLLNILSSARQGHLPCQEELDWGKREAFELRIRNLLAAMLVPPHATFSPADPTLMSLVPAVLYRLQRCEKDDVKALKALMDKTLNAKQKVCPNDVPLRTLWLANEFTPESYKKGEGGPPSAKTLISASRSTRSVVPLDASINAFAEFYQAIPKYDRPAEDNRILYTRSKVLLIFSDLDPLLPLTQANNLAITYSDGNTHVRHPINRAVHLAGSHSVYKCVQNNVVQFQTNGQWADEASCYATAMPNDYGIDFTADASLYLGNKDAWEFTVPRDAEPPEGRLVPEARMSFIWRVVKGFLWLLLWLLVGAAVLGAGYVIYTRFNFRANHMSDNFYDNLHR